MFGDPTYDVTGRWIPAMSELLPQDAHLTVFVGRNAELRQLITGLDRALEGRGGMFLVSGEPGIGKTRVAEELALGARKRGATVYWGRSTLAEGAPPYWPWVQILRSLLRDVGEAEFRRLAGSGLPQILQVVPDLRGYFADVTPTSIDDDRTRFGIYDSVMQLLLNAGRARPMVLVVDDLHWADTPSLLLLQLLAGHLPHSRLMVIGTYRDLELGADHPLRTHLADFVRRGETTELRISGLKDPDVVSLLRVLTGFEPAVDVVRRLQAQTGGNPFFLSELARSLGDGDAEPSRWKFSASTDVVPQGIGAVLRRRIEALSADCRSALEIAAVAGQEIDLDTLEAATKTGRPRLLDLLDEAIASGVVTRRDGRYAFAHGLVRDAVYSRISAARRGELHRLIGDLLEGVPLGGSTTAVAQLAHHFVEACVVDPTVRAKALGYASAAGRRAVAELAYEEGVRLFELALTNVAPPDPAQRAALLLDLGRANYMAGDIGSALDVAEEVSRLAEKLNDGSLMARAALVVRGVGGVGLSYRIVQLCNVAMRRPIRNKALKIQVLSQLTVALMQTGMPADERAAKKASREAVRLAADAVDPDVVFSGIHARQMATSGPDGVDERLELAERTLRLARETGRSSMANWAYHWRLEALVQLGRIDEAEAEVAVQLKLADELHEPLARWRALHVQSWLALLRGRFAQARAFAEEARQLGRKGHHAAGEFGYLAHGVVLAIHLGGSENAFQAMEELVRPLPEDMHSGIYRSGGLAVMGRLDEARIALRLSAPSAFENLGSAIDSLSRIATITEVIALVGDRDLAERTYKAALPFARLNVSVGAAGLTGSVSRCLGILATTLERWDDAAKHFEEAIEFERRMGAPPFVVRSQVAYAEMLLRTGRDGDLRHAQKLLESAIATSRELGMVPWQERAIRLVKGLEERGVTDHPLSSRELEVAALVAQGLSNRAIAGRLHLSERTAESHVKNICDKLGFNSRSQVAAWIAARRAPG